MSLDISRPSLPFDLSHPYGLEKVKKESLLLSVLVALTQWHRQQCMPYRHILEGGFGNPTAQTLEGLPFIPTRLFKSINLLSIESKEILKMVTSSGTTGQAVSKIYLDRETAMRQSSVLSAIVMNFLGKRRLPMVIVDSSDLIKNRTQYSVRSAAILGFSAFGREHHYCLDHQLQLRMSDLYAYLDQHQHESILIFGFTYIVWQRLYQSMLATGKKIKIGQDSILIHGGGWKKLVDQQVSHQVFKEKIKEQLGIERVFSYYGMVEQAGSIFMECEYGYLHSPVFADVIIRDPITFVPMPFGKTGVVEVLSALPLSYPGHILLTEDMGTIHGEDDCLCGRLGKYFSIEGRLPEAEIRGCSDTRTI